jgi:2-methylcitrate dehydratase PrpD
VGVNRFNVHALNHNRPATELEAKFSMPFCMAILLLRRRAGLAEFTDEVVNLPEVEAMTEKIEYGVHPEAEAAGYDKMTTIIDIDLHDGRRINGRADFGKGSPAHPMSDAELADKFRECAEWGGLASPGAEQVIELVFDLERVANVTELTRLLQAGGRRESTRQGRARGSPAQAQD